MRIKVDVTRLPKPTLPPPNVRKEVAPEGYIQSLLATRHYEETVRNQKGKRRGIAFGQTDAYAKKQLIVVDLYKEGKNAREIADEMGLSVATIRSRIQIAKRSGLITETDTHPPYPPPWTEAEEELTARLYEAGANFDEIAEKVGKSKNAVSGRITKMRKEGKIHAFQRKFKTRKC